MPGSLQPDARLPGQAAGASTEPRWRPVLGPTAHSLPEGVLCRETDLSRTSGTHTNNPQKVATDTRECQKDKQQSHGEKQRPLNYL